MDIPVVETLTLDAKERKEAIKEWAEDDSIKMATAFLCYIGDGSSIENYFYQIGFPFGNSLITTKELILEIGTNLESYPKEINELLGILQLRDHISLYYDKIKVIPPWGSREFFELKNKGRTPRILYGPHKSGCLNPQQRREVIIDKKGELVFGPVIR